jgi:hypothetical protein
VERSYAIHFPMQPSTKKRPALAGYARFAIASNAHTRFVLAPHPSATARDSDFEAIGRWISASI